MSEDKKASGFSSYYSGLTSRLRWGGSSSPANNQSGSSSETNSIAENNGGEGENEVVDENSISMNEVPESEKSSFLAFVKRALGGIDLSKITAPPFILAPMSTLETNSDLMAHPDLFCRIATKETPLERFLEYTRWYISRFHRQSTTGSGKKPYNPIIGERFLCSWESPEFGKLTLKSEQVSHHPPILGEYYENEKLGIMNMGHFGLKAHFSGTVVKARVDAHNWTRLIRHEEDYVFTSPTFVIRGFLVANPFFDAVGEALVHGVTTGYKAILEYKDKPWFRGEYHQLAGRIFHEDNPDDILYTLSGNWKKVINITDNKTGKTSVFFDNAWEMMDRKVAPIEEQGELESQQVWRGVTKALMESNYSLAGTTKSVIEDRQRELAKQRSETGEEFRHEYFYYDAESERWLLKGYEERFESIAAAGK